MGLVIEHQDQVLASMDAAAEPYKPVVNVKPQPTLVESTKAAFAKDNSVASFFMAETRGVDNSRDFDFDSLSTENLSGYEEYANRFVNAKNSQMSDAIKSQIRREREGELTLHNTDGLTEFAVRGAANILDWHTFLPVIGVVGKSYMVGKTVAGTAARVAGLAAADQGLRELSLHPTQETRTVSESAVNTGAALLLGGMLGPVVAKMSPELKQQALKDIIDMSQDTVARDAPAYRSGGAAAVVDPVPAPIRSGSEKLSTIEGISDNRLAAQTPNIRLATSESDSARKAGQILADNAFRTEKNYEGIATPHAAETQIERRNTTMLGDAIEGLNKWAKDFRKSDATPDIMQKELARAGINVGIDKLAGDGVSIYLKRRGYFNALVASALRNGDRSEIVEVQNAAQIIRAKVLNPLKEDAMNRGLFDDVIKAAEKRAYSHAMDNSPIAKQVKELEAKLAAETDKANRKVLKTQIEESKVKRDLFAEQSKTDAAKDAAQLVSKTSESYLHRMWDRDSIAVRKGDFVARIEDWIKREAPDHEDPYGAAEEVFLNIVHGHNLTTNSKNFSATKAGALKERLLMIPDNEVSDFLINDVEAILHKYVPDMNSSIVMHDTFAGKKLDDLIDGVRFDYDELIDAVRNSKDKTPAQIEKKVEELRKAYIEDKSDIQFLHDFVTGNNQPDINNWTRVGGVVKKLSAMASLGGQTLSSIPDIGRLIWVNGLGRFSSAMAKYIGNVDFRNISKEEAKRLGYGFEKTLNSRFESFADNMSRSTFSNRTDFEKGVGYLAKQHGLLSAMAHWNSSMKHVAGTLHQDRMINAMLDYKNLDKGEIAYLAQNGIGDDMALRIAEQFRKHGIKDGSFHIGNVRAWDDIDARDAFSNSVYKNVNHTINSVHAGTVPRALRDPTLGSIVFQFKSFMFAAQEQMMMAGIQEHDARALQGALAVVFMGAVSYQLKQSINNINKDKELEWDSKKLLFSGIEASGILGLPMEFNNVMNSVENMPSIQKAIGLEADRRHRQLNTAEYIAGPALGKVYETSKSLINGISDEGFHQKDIHALRKDIPMQNIFYIRYLLDKTEQAFNEKFGIPK